MFKDEAFPTITQTLEIETPSKRPSARAQRQEELERVYCSSSLDAVLTARTELELDLRLAASVFGIRGYDRLPRYRKQYVRGYIHGARDALARKAGRPASIVPPPDERVPTKIKHLQPGVTWHQHPHGGGWVASTAYIALTAYVGPNAVVYDEARVYDSARIYGDARICETAEVYGAAHVHGKAVVAGSAQLYGSVHVSGDTLLLEGKYEGGIIRNRME